MEPVPALGVGPDQPGVRTTGGTVRVEHGAGSRGANCAAPDTGNMETLHLFANEAQSKQWLEPLLNGEIRSAFAMTEPAVASSDARNIETTMARRRRLRHQRPKWWISGAADPRCKILIVMGRTNPDAASHQQQSMVLVPVDTPGVTSSGLLRYSVGRTSTDIARSSSTTCGSRWAICSARRAAGSRSRRLGWAGTHPSLHARDRRCRACVGLDGRPGELARRVRQAAGRAGCHAAADCVVPQRDRPGAVAVPQGGVDHRRARQQGRAHQLVAQIKAVAPQVACNVMDRAIQVHGAAGIAMTPRWPGCTAAPRDAAVRRARRGAHAHHRPQRAGPREVRAGRGGDCLVASTGGELSGAWNFRDVAEETGIRPGRLYRASELSNLDDSGRATLIDLRVADVTDLRSDREVNGAVLVWCLVRSRFTDCRFVNSASTRHTSMRSRRPWPRGPVTRTSPSWQRGT